MKLPFPQNEYAQDYRAMLAGRDVFVHDFDGVHYDYADHPDIYDFLGDVKAHVLKNLIPEIPLTFAEMKDIGKASYRETGDGLRYFLPLAADHGYDEAEFRAQVHIDYHRVGCEWALEQCPYLFEPCESTNAGFDALQGKVRHAILTQSCVDNWARPILQHMNRLQFFEQDKLIGFAECGFVTKADSTAPLEMAIKLMNADPRRVAFIEDSLLNLKKAKELSPDILTVYCHHKKPLADVPSYVDMMVPKVHHLNQIAAMAHAPVGTPKYFSAPDLSKLILTP